MVKTRHISIMAAAMATTLGLGATSANATFTDDQYKKAGVALNALQSLSLMTFGDATDTSDIGGRVWVGGTANLASENSGATANGGSKTVKTSNVGFATLTANALGSNTQVLSGTNAAQTAVIGNANGHTLGAGVTTTFDSTISTQAATYKGDAEQLSTILDSLATSSITNWNSLSLSSGTNVFNMSASFFSSQNSNFDNLFSNLNSSETVIINVLCGSSASCSAIVDQGSNFNGNAGQALLASNVIWNFSTSSSSLGAVTSVGVKYFFGSILAPDATVTDTTNTPINGSVIANVFNSQGEIHLDNYAGSESFIPMADRVGAVPEPSTWTAMILGFGLVGWSIRRQRRAGIALRI